MGVCKTQGSLCEAIEMRGLGFVGEADILHVDDLRFPEVANWS